jgi:hypothetical protein
MTGDHQLDVVGVLGHRACEVTLVGRPEVSRTTVTFSSDIAYLSRALRAFSGSGKISSRAGLPSRMVQR